MVNRLNMTNRITSFSTSDLEKFSDLSTDSKLGRLSKAYSTTDLTKPRTRRASAGSDRTFDRQTVSSKGKSKQVSDVTELKNQSLRRITQNIANDRNSEKKLTNAYKERFRGIVQQTMSRDTKKRDSAVLSAGRTNNNRLPPIKQSNKVTIPKSESTPKSAPIQKSATAPKPVQNRNAAAARPKGAGAVRNQPEQTNKKITAGKTAGQPPENATAKANKPGGRMANVVNRATIANRSGGPRKPVDDMKLNKKYNSCVCEPCKMQIHEKLKRGYAKYRSLEKMKACTKCSRLVIDFDFYLICVDCSKEAKVCAKCAVGSTTMTGARFVEVVRNGVEENLLGMSEKELEKFAEKHAKIGKVERQISFIAEMEPEGASAHLATPASSRASSRASSAHSRTSSTPPKPVQSQKKVKIVNKARSLTSSSSPLCDVSDNDAYNELTTDSFNYDSDFTEKASEKIRLPKAEGSARSRRASAGSGRRSRKHSAEVIRQIRSLTNLDVDSPVAAQSVIREIRSLTDFEIDEDEEYELSGPSCSPVQESPIYTPFSSTTDKSIVDSNDIEPSLGSRTSTREKLSPLPHRPLSADKTSLDVPEYSPVPPIISISTAETSTDDVNIGPHSFLEIRPNDGNKIEAECSENKRDNIPNTDVEQFTDQIEYEEVSSYDYEDTFIESDNTEPAIETVSQSDSKGECQNESDNELQFQTNTNSEPQIETNVTVDTNQVSNHQTSKDDDLESSSSSDTTIRQDDILEQGNVAAEETEHPFDIFEAESTAESISSTAAVKQPSPQTKESPPLMTTDELRLMTEAAKYGILLKDRGPACNGNYDSVDLAPRRGCERQERLDLSGGYDGINQEDVDMIRQNFERFQVNDSYDIVEVHTDGETSDYMSCMEPQGPSGVDEECQMYYEDCYEYRYYPHRFRLEDIPEEGTLSKDTTYISLAPTMPDKEGTSISLTAPIEREPTIDDTARDLAVSALFKASVDIVNSR